MGLDQTWFKAKEKVDLDILNNPYYDAECAISIKVVQTYEENKLEDFHYHRKVPALEYFMATEFDKQLLDIDFNCMYLHVPKELLDKLQKQVKEKSLNEKATGFFWGSHTDEDYEDIQKAINKAYKAIDEGYDIYYTSNW